MWFDDEDISGRKLFPRNRGRQRRVLSVNARVGDMRRATMHRLGTFLLVPAVIAVAAALGWYGLRLAGRLLFSNDGRFTITRLEIKGSSICLPITTHIFGRPSFVLPTRATVSKRKM